VSGLGEWGLSFWFGVVDGGGEMWEDRYVRRDVVELEGGGYSIVICWAEGWFGWYHTVLSMLRDMLTSLLE